ncbi:DUF1570 domain-containing protein [Tautonia marina]|uniref:DUF1570 domain-containing protein n=1 Tax=Tautonia marina TaxID=2653855 RepID=UPI00137630A4|nr:DUF1570 domain-containing protein [Tautonia marina]
MRGIREAGLLVSLVAVMAVTAYYCWLGTVDSSRVDLAMLRESPSPADERSAAPVETRNAQAGRLRSGSNRSFWGDSGVWGNAPVSSAIGESSPLPRKRREGVSSPEPKASPSPPSVQAPEDGPRLPIRSPLPDASLELTQIEDLPTLRLPIDLSGISPASTAAPSTPAPLPKGPSAPAEPVRMLVGDASGRVLVSRLYARGPSGPVVQLPDGSLGWPEGEVLTDRPFRPWSARQIANSFRNGREQTFRVIERSPYVVLTEGSNAFGEQAADLLQALYHDLAACFEDGGIPVTEPEFPLVAVIYRDEAAFRRYRPVDPDVRAYYEVASNRIILYESSPQDLRAPELAALSRPQTIAHEGIHQILQNIGVQPRLADWPPWLVEGLAEYYSPTAPPDSSEGPRSAWGDYGRANFGRVNPLHMATLIDLQDPSALLAHLRGPGPSKVSPAWASLGPEEPWVTHLMLRSELSPTDYALAWCLTHYLARNHPDAFRSYLLALAQRPPLEPRTPKQHLKEFIEVFGVHPSTLAHRIDRHLSSLRYDQVPYYAVRFEQMMPSGLTRRGTLVSPSPTMITQWLQAQTLPDGAPLLWWAAPFASRNLARLSCESWLLHQFP